MFSVSVELCHLYSDMCENSFARFFFRCATVEPMFLCTVVVPTSGTLPSLNSSIIQEVEL